VPFKPKRRRRQKTAAENSGRKQRSIGQMLAVLHEQQGVVDCANEIFGIMR